MPICQGPLRHPSAPLHIHVPPSWQGKTQRSCHPVCQKFCLFAFMYGCGLQERAGLPCQLESWVKSSDLFHCGTAELPRLSAFSLLADKTSAGARLLGSACSFHATHRLLALVTMGTESNRVALEQVRVGLTSHLRDSTVPIMTLSLHPSVSKMIHGN